MSAPPDARPYSALAAECLNALRDGDPIWRPAAEALAAAASAPEAERAAKASRALFREVVEPLADSFRASDARAYIALFAHVLHVVRRLPGGEDLDAALRRHGLDDEQALVERAERISAPSPPCDPGRVQRVAVLSRVTIGADIAVTSLFLRAALERFSGAEVLFVGSARNAALFGGEPRLRHVESPYPRGGSLGERLTVWLETRRVVASAASDCAMGGFLLLDPDSRIGQLGLLPFLPDDKGYVYFDSRSLGDGHAGPIGALAADWLAEALGGEAPLPWLEPSAGALKAALLSVGPLRRPVAAVNFGVGGNEVKRAGAAVELAACQQLIERGYTLVLDRGAGAEEAANCEALAARLRADGHGDDRLAVFEGPFDAFAAVVGQSDLFVGYDSAAAHAAAALGVRAIDIFAGAASPIMLSRWSPWGLRPAEVLAVAPGESQESVARRFGERLG